MIATYSALIDALYLPSVVRHAYIFPQMHNNILLSLRQFCNNNYNVRLTWSTISIDHLYDPWLSLHGYRNRTTGMWTINLSYQALLLKDNSQPLQANNVYELSKKRNIITYLHKAAFSPFSATWIEAVNSGLFTTWLDLIVDLV